MKSGLDPSADYSSISNFMTACQRSAADLGIQYFLDSGLSLYQAAMVVRADVMTKVSDIENTISRARAQGYLLPDSPFTAINLMNKTRRIFTPVTLPAQDVLFKTITDLAKVDKEYRDGTITFDRGPGYQLASFEVSADGITDPTGNALADILGYQPDGDAIKRKRALDSLARLNFSRRKTYVLFTADLDGGILVCWQRMHDASGYRITRREVFSEADLGDILMDNQTADQNNRTFLADNRIFQMLSFYDWLDPKDAVFYLDRSVSADKLYSYIVTGRQKKVAGTPKIFDVPTSTLFYSPAIAQAVDSFVAAEAQTFGRDADTISPYPALAKAVYGDESYSWILAGCNLLASARRGDSADVSRSVGYVGSTPQSLAGLAKNGQLVIPQDPHLVQSAVDSSIVAYGISQTITVLLEGLGLTEFIGGKDDLGGISEQQSSVDASTSGLSRILSVIDPETATLDSKLLVSALTSPTRSQGFRDLNFVSIVDNKPTVSIQDAVGTETLDLSHYSGIARLLEIIRLVYDFYPGSLNS